MFIAAIHADTRTVPAPVLFGSQIRGGHGEVIAASSAFLNDGPDGMPVTERVDVLSRLNSDTGKKGIALLAGWGKILWAIVLSVVIQMVGYKGAFPALTPRGIHPIHKLPTVMAGMRPGANLVIEHYSVFRNSDSPKCYRMSRCSDIAIAGFQLLFTLAISWHKYIVTMTPFGVNKEVSHS